MSKKFTVRPGTTDLGKDYEQLNIARLVLELVTDPNIKNFAISSNDEKFGDFDDIVVETESSNGVEKYALQLKHRDNCKSLSSKKLSKSKEFAVSKYFRSYEEIIGTGASHTLILLTNYKSDVQDGTSIAIDNFTAKISKHQVNELLDTSHGRGQCYKFEMEPNTHKEYEKFFKRFFLYTNQANVHQIQNEVAQKFQEKFRCTETECLKFFDFISKWSKQKGVKSKLDANTMKRVIGLCLLRSSMKPWVFGPTTKKMKILKKAVKKCRISTFREESYEVLKMIWGEGRETLKRRFTKVQEVAKIYQVGTVKRINDLRDEECSLLLWLMKKCPLIIDANDCTLKAVQFCQDDKFIILGENALDGDFRNLSNLKVHSPALERILTTFEISLNGKKPIVLAKILDKNEELETVTTDDLLQMVDKTIQIGNGQESLPEPYIPRRLSVEVFDYSYLEKIKPDTIAVINCLNRSDKVRLLSLKNNTSRVSEHLQGKKDSISSRRLTTNILLAEDRCSNEDFEAVCRSNSQVQNIYLLQVTMGEDLELLRHKGDINDLRNYSHAKIFEERNFYENENQDNVHLLIGEPGMGKTILMNSLKNNISPNFWTIILNSNEMSSLSEYIQKEGSTKMEN